MKKKMQLGLLGILLVAVIAGGVWLLRPQEADQPRENEGTIGWQQEDNVRYKLAGRTDQTGRPFWGYDSAYERFFTYQGQLCQLVSIGEDSGSTAVELVSVGDGSVLKTYDESCFLPYWFSALYLDGEDQLWALYSSGDLEFPLLGLCEPGQTLEDAVPLDIADSAGQTPAVAVWGDFAVVQVRGETSCLAVINRTNGTASILDWDVADFCVSGGGMLYALRYTEQGTRRVLEGYSLPEGKSVWSNQALPLMSTSLWSTEGGLFLLGDSPEKKIFPVDLKTGALGEMVLGFWSVAGLQDELDACANSLGVQFGLDSGGGIFLSCVEEDETAGYVRMTWKLEPYVLELAPEDIVTLTITSPYVVESLESSIRLYQQQHPEVQVVWDVQYMSREELQANHQEYKDQLAIRVMAGDVGDLVMVTGSGLDEKTVTDTDAFADVSGYLEDCPFKEELDFNLPETLRGADGAIRAVPVAISPDYYLLNETLWKELGSPFDPNGVTWMELLDMALEWKEEGTDLSLCACGAGEQLESDMLTALLLANLYAAEQPDGSVQLDQPYLRELLTKWKQLQGTTYLARSDGDVGKALFSARPTISGYFVDQFYHMADRASKYGVSLQAVSKPKGEVWKKQQGYAFCWAVSGSSEQKEAAWDLLQFIISAKSLPGCQYTKDTLAWNSAAQETVYQQLRREWEDSIAYGALGQEAEDLERLEKNFREIQQLQSIPYSSLSQPYGWYQAVCEPVEKYLRDELTLDEAMETANASWERFVLE